MPINATPNVEIAEYELPVKNDNIQHIKKLATKNVDGVKILNP
jgi:hypothetical protein